MIGAHNIGQFKRGALLINTARGELVDTEALLSALDQGILSGAGLDVLEGEEVLSEEKQLLLNPKASEESLKQALRNRSLLQRPDLVITPHIAFDSRRGRGAHSGHDHRQHQSLSQRQTAESSAYMTQTPHVEKHFTSTEVVRDIVIGMSDGLTVPFALAAGLTGVVSASHIIVTAGLAEVAAGSIAMGLGGYLAARGDAEHYASERKREQHEVQALPEVEAREVVEVFSAYGLTPEESAPVVAALQKRPEAYVDFMMRFELGLEEPDPKRAMISAMTIAGSYIVGGLIPLSPYFLLPQVHVALVWSVFVTLTALAVFGFFKARATGAPAVRGAGQTVLIGGLAAAAAFLIARLFSGTPA